MASNQPWKSKKLIIDGCKSIGATLEPDRQTIAEGKRVFVVHYEDKNMGFYTMRDIYNWLYPKLKHGGR